MLVEVSSSAFLEGGNRRPPVFFHSGLNVVLGDAPGSNSIGKSTFLLILDFVYGGNDYPQKATDVIKHVGHHEVRFSFRFGNETFRFCRQTDTPHRVWLCDETGEKKEEWDLRKYTSFLSDQYGISQQNLSFREYVGRFIRVYQKDNLNEHLPLNAARQEPGADIVCFLMKTFDKYEAIAKLKHQAEEAERSLRSFNEAVKNNHIGPIPTKPTPKKQ